MSNSSSGSADSHYDIVLIGGGPGGYAGAIRGAKLGKKVLCVEKEHLGGVCLNWGCIPTKALLSNAHLVEMVGAHGDHFGVQNQPGWDFHQMIKRSRSVADRLNQGIAGLFKKYKVNHIMGTAKVVGPRTVAIQTKEGETRKVTAGAIVIATGARPRGLPGVEFDGKTIISSKEAMVLPEIPKRMVIIGAGAIGMEFSYFYNTIGSKVTVVEMLDRILPNEDEEVSKELTNILRKKGLEILTSSKTTQIEKTAQGAVVTVETPQGIRTLEGDVVLVAIGVVGNVENLFGPDVKVAIEKNHIKVNKKYETSIPGIYAVGDVIGPPWLAHVAHHEADVCIERICGHSDRYVDYENIPGCTYTEPGVASIGLTEAQAKERGRPIKVGKFPFMAIGRALASDEPEGFVKLIFDAEHGELLGAHILGTQATEMISELVMARRLEATAEDLFHAIHPHPTYSEAVMEAAGLAFGQSVHY
jgi:dihydrolipoamide dehydrogenase